MKILNIKIYNGSEWIDYTLDSLSDLNLANGEGLGSIKSSNLNDDDRPYTEDELPVASAHEAWAFGKGCQATAKRAISWGDRNKNSGNTAAVFGQLNKNTAPISLVQGGTIYNGGAAAIVIGTNIYNRDNPTSSVMNDGGGASSAIFGTNLYKQTGDIYVVADCLGHKDVNTTKKHYAAITEDIRRKAATSMSIKNDK